MLLILLFLPTCVVAAENHIKWDNPYSDVNVGLWSYTYIKELNLSGIFPSQDRFDPYAFESRGSFVSCIYAIHLKNGGKKVNSTELAFSDVPLEHPYFSAVAWAKQEGIVNGISDTLFDPAGQLTREHICTILMRYAEYAEVELRQVHEPKQFVDSLRISEYARSPVVACQMAGLINGYSNGFFKPFDSISRQECAAVLWRLWDAIANPTDGESDIVDTGKSAYDDLYETFVPVPDPLVPQGDVVDLSYFDRVAIVGDSVSVMLQYYCASTKALGNATFLCAGSLSASNALGAVGISSVHPFYQGKKILVEDGVAACGADIVYIMLGINNISFGIDRAASDMVTLIDRILVISPHVEIVIESVTPMAAGSSITSESLNNNTIAAYNQRMKQICEERGWYFVDVAEVFTGEDGTLPAEYCSDNNGMGIHFTASAAAVWAEYLKNHVPEKLVK